MSSRLAPPGRLAITDEEFSHDRAGVLARLRAEGDLDFGPAVLDPAHIGDIQGSLGTISLRDRAPRRTWSRRLVTFAAIAGPGIIVMTGDNDAGGVQTYTQAGQHYGTSMLWILAALFVVLFTAQEMVTRLGAVTGVGHARLIRERFGRFWNIFSVGDLFVLNFLTLLTEFIGVNFALAYFGISKDYSVPVAAILLFTFAATGNFRRWERFMLAFVAGSAVVIPLFFLAHPRVGPIVRGTLVPGVQGGITGGAILLIVAIVGTTVAPWQLFFQQSNILDKRISPRWLAYERADTFTGVILTTVFAGMMICVAAFALNGTRRYGPAASYTDSGWFDSAIHATLGSTAGAMAAVMLLVAAVLGAGAVSLSTSYAFGDSLGRKHSLHRTVRTAPVFYLAYGAQITAASLVVLLASNSVLGTLTQWVQVLAGILLPSAILFLVLLCNDKQVLGPWVNKTWQNVVDFTIIGVLVVLSMILVVSTLFTSVNGVVLTEALFGASAGGVLIIGAPALLRSRRRRTASGRSADRLADVRHLDRDTWRMPPLDRLPKPVISPLRTAGLLVLRGYLIASVLLITIKIFSSFIH
ncbi:MAG TPA: NRAMP family divalent metal transporter [Streptosporangiaceae bacterium]|nr:NRAMP family divalent metal transporter [Streptosporangiaceae bacterium]